MLLGVAGLLTPQVFAASGSIAKVYYYPQDQGSYEVVNYFLWQTTAVNTNTTVSVSIDGEPPIPLIYQGSKSEIIPGDTVPRELFTWKTTVSAITTPGRHTFQIFGHYYVWQEADNYWAEFNSCSDLHSFFIGFLENSFSPSPDPISSQTTPHPIAAPSESTIHGIFTFTLMVITATVTLQHRFLRKKVENKPLHI